MAWTYKGGCLSFDEDCCYYNGELEKEFFETKEAAELEALRHFPDISVFWREVFEVKDTP